MRHIGLISSFLGSKLMRFIYMYSPSQVKMKLLNRYFVCVPSITRDKVEEIDLSETNDVKMTVA